MSELRDKLAKPSLPTRIFRMNHAKMLEQLEYTKIPTSLISTTTRAEINVARYTQRFQEMGEHNKEIFGVFRCRKINKQEAGDKCGGMPMAASCEL